jgi:hypothetical protein
MVETLDKLKDCLYSHDHGEFTNWLLNSNCSKVGPYLKEERFNNTLQYVVYTCLEEILDVLMKNPEADYFWYTYPEHGGKLTWSEPHHDVVPSDSLRVDKQKIKVLLRDIKINQLLNAN